MEWDGVNWVNLAYDRELWEAVFKLRNEFLCSVKCGQFLACLGNYISFPRTPLCVVS